MPISSRTARCSSGSAENARTRSRCSSTECARRRCPAIRSPRSMRRVDVDAVCALCWTKSDGKGSCRPPPGRRATMRRRTGATRGSALRSARLGPALPHRLKYGSRAATKIPSPPAAITNRAPRFRSVFPASSLLCCSRCNHISVNQRINTKRPSEQSPARITSAS